MEPINIEEIGGINPDLKVLAYRHWTISRIAPMLYFYRQNIAGSFASGMTPEGIEFESEREALLAAIRDIERIETLRKS